MAHNGAGTTLEERATRALAAAQAAEARRGPETAAAVRAARRTRLEALVAGVVGADWATFVTSPPNSRAVILDAITFTLAGELATVAGVEAATLVAAMVSAVPGVATPLVQPVATLADLGQLYRRARGEEG